MLTRLLIVSVALAACAATARAADFSDNFNGPVYVDGDLPPQNGWATTSGASGYPIDVENTAIDGRIRASHRPAGGLRAAFKNFGPIGPGGDGKIYLKFDLILGGGANTATVMSHFMFRDANNLEMGRFDVRPAGARGRLQGGGGIVTDYMLVDGANPSQRSIWAVIDTLYDVGGVGGRVEFYQDSVSATNKLPETGIITYPSDRLDQIARIEIDTTGTAGDDAFARYDNILVTDAVPEPAAIGAFMIGVLTLLRRSRR